MKFNIKLFDKKSDKIDDITRIEKKLDDGQRRFSCLNPPPLFNIIKKVPIIFKNNNWLSYKFRKTMFI